MYATINNAGGSIAVWYDEPGEIYGSGSGINFQFIQRAIHRAQSVATTLEGSSINESVDAPEASAIAHISISLLVILISHSVFSIIRWIYTTTRQWYYYFLPIKKNLLNFAFCKLLFLYFFS